VGVAYQECFVKNTPFVHMLYCFPVQRNSLGSIAFSVHRCMQNAELSLFVSCGAGPFQKGLRSLSGVGIKPDWF